MRKNTLFVAVLVGLMMMALLAAPAMAGAKIKIALDCPPDPDKCGTYLWSKTFSEILDYKGLKTVLYQRDALGGEAEKLDQVSQGLLEISNSDLAKAGSIDPTIFGFDLPFLFQDMEHFYRVLNGTDLLDKVNQGTTKQGVRVLSLVPMGGMTGIATTNKKIRTPKDFKGVRMRALDQNQAKTYAAWGANAVVIPWSEVYNALQTGIASGYLNAANVPVMFKHTEVLKYYSEAKIRPSLRIAIASEDWFQGLSKEHQEIILHAVSEANDVVKSWVAKIEERLLGDLRAAGMEVYINSTEEKEKFARLVRPLYIELSSEEVAQVFLEASEKMK